MYFFKYYDGIRLVLENVAIDPYTFTVKYAGSKEELMSYYSQSGYKLR